MLVVIMNEDCKLRGTVEFQTCWTGEESEDDAFQVRNGKEKGKNGIPE